MVENLAMNEFRRQVGEYINQTYYASKAFILTKGDKKVGALIPMAMFNRLTELEAFYAQTVADREQTQSTDAEVIQTSGPAAE